MNEQSVVVVLLAAVGAAFWSVAAPRFSDHGVRDRKAWGAAGLGTFLFVLAGLWSPLAKRLPPDLVASVGALASSGVVWLLVLAASWGYLAVTSIIALRQRTAAVDVVFNDLLRYQQALELWVTPRCLTPEAIRIVAEHLKPHTSRTVKIRYPSHDDEAAGLANDMNRALYEGGWKGQVEGGTVLQHGIRINAWYTQDTMNARGVRAVRPGDVLNEAFDAAGVKIDGGSSGGAVDEDRVEIEIGPRRRGARLQKFKWPMVIHGPIGSGPLANEPHR